MTDRPPGSGFARGFFGGLGLLAALALVGVLLFGWKVVSDFRSGVRAEDLGPDRIALTDPAAPCRATLETVARDYRVAAPLALQYSPTDHSIAKLAAFRCDAIDAAGLGVIITATAGCGSESASWCETIQDVRRPEGKPIRLR